MDNLLICFKKKKSHQDKTSTLMYVSYYLYIYCWNEVEGIMDSSK